MRKFILLTLLTTMILVGMIPTSALAAKQEKVVRVGWFQYPGCSEGHDGDYTGYTYDYLMEIAKYTEWKYEFVENDFATCAKMLENGEIDVMAGLQKNSQREQIYDFTEVPYGQTYCVLFTSNDSLLQPYDYNNYNGIRIGILNETTSKEFLDKFAESNGFSYEAKFFDSMEELDTALSEGTIDAGNLISYIATDKTRILAKFAPVSIYFVTTKGNKEVLEGLDQALKLIKINRLYFDAELYEKYYISKESIQLTKEEQDFIDKTKNEPISVGVIDNGMPISFWNAEKNAYDGIAIDIFDTICKKTGLNVKYVSVDKTLQNDITETGSKKPQIVLGVPILDGVSNDKTLFLSQSLLDVPLAIVGRNDSNDSWLDKAGTVAMAKDFDIAQTYIEDKFPDWEIITYPTLKDCMTAVADGQADVTVYYQSSISYYQQKPYFNKLKLVPASLTESGLCVAGYNEESQALLWIIDKGIGKISEKEIQSLMLNFTMLNTYQMTLSDILYEYQMPLIVIVLLTFAILIVLIVLYSVKKRSSKNLSIAYEQKNEALIEAEKASAAKGNFMSRMSHEIRTPLNAVIGYNTIARNAIAQAKTDEERRQSEMKVMDCLSKSDIASRHLLTIINDVLDMSAIESGKIKVVNERFDFKSMISSLTAIFYSQAKAKDVDFSVEFCSQMEEWIIGDQMRVNQILTNLLSNAIKFTSEGGEVKLSIRPQTSDHSIQLHFEVLDTGIGMSEDYMGQIWNPFEQEDSSISRRFGGTGLGLSITKTLVDMLGGSISVKSEVGKGSTFFVDLPFARTEQPEVKGPYDFSNINALIVDDDISTCDYIRLLFSRSGVRNSAVYSGEDAINAITISIEKNDPYTICLIDWRMPKMDGLETIRRIRGIAGVNMPIIVITAYDFTEVAERAAEIGVNMFISKPLFQSSLFDLLANISNSPVPHNEEKFDSYDFSGARILLAEDNAMNIEISKSMLEPENLILDIARNGQEAADMFLAAPVGTYSLILMDIQMPVMDGYQSSRFIRESDHPEAKTIPIIAMTADAFANDIAEARAAGMNDHIAKPIDTSLLLQKLATFMPSEKA